MSFIYLSKAGECSSCQSLWSSETFLFNIETIIVRSDFSGITFGFYTQYIQVYPSIRVWTILQVLTVVGTDRSLLMGHNALLLRQIARDLLHAISHRHDTTWHSLSWSSQQHWLKQCDNKTTKLKSDIILLVANWDNFKSDIHTWILICYKDKVS